MGQNNPTLGERLVFAGAIRKGAKFIYKSTGTLRLSVRTTNENWWANKLENNRKLQQKTSDFHTKLD